MSGKRVPGQVWRKLGPGPGGGKGGGGGVSGGSSLGRADDRVAALMEQYRQMLRFLGEKGCLLNSVRPEVRSLLLACRVFKPFWALRPNQCPLPTSFDRADRAGETDSSVFKLRKTQTAKETHRSYPTLSNRRKVNYQETNILGCVRFGLKCRFSRALPRCGNLYLFQTKHQVSRGAATQILPPPNTKVSFERMFAPSFEDASRRPCGSRSITRRTQLSVMLKPKATFVPPGTP